MEKFCWIAIERGLIIDNKEIRSCGRVGQATQHTHTVRQHESRSLCNQRVAEFVYDKSPRMWSVCCI